MIRVADYIVSYIRKVLGVKDVFMVSGGGIMHLTDALAQNKDVHVICTHHEQSAAMALEAYSRTIENFGAGFFTTGPGATNALTGLIGAWQDSVPCIFVSGQVKRKEAIYNSGVKGLRQFGVQEVNILPIVSSVTKYAVMLNDPLTVRYELEKMTRIAKEGRPGPVWLDVPLDVQGALIDPRKLESYPKHEHAVIKTKPTANEIQRVLAMLKGSKRPIVIAGQGIRLARARQELSRFIEKYQIPLVCSYLGIDVLPADHALNIGPIGIKGGRAGNTAVQNADLVIAIGTSLHVGEIGYEYELFAPKAAKVVIDIDRTSHKKKTIPIDLYVNSDAREFLKKMNCGSTAIHAMGWAERCRSWKAKYPVCLEEYSHLKDKVNIYYFVKTLCELTGNNDVILSDAGSAYYAVAQAVSLKEGQRYITSGAIATMGYTLPAAIGAAAATGKRVLGITGDGSFQFNIQELQTLVHYKMPVKLFILNNDGYLSIRFTQQRFFDNRYLGEGPKSGVSCPDTKKIAKAYGLPFFRITKNAELKSKIRKVMDKKGPVICEILTPRDQLIIPTVSSLKKDDGTMVSRPLDDMYPFLSREEYQANRVADKGN